AAATSAVRMSAATKMATRRPLSASRCGLLRLGVSPAVSYPRRRANRPRAVWNVASDHRTRAGARAAADAHRRHQHAVAADERTVSDERPVLRRPVVISG